MNRKIFFGFIFFLVVVFLLGTYWLIPLNHIEFESLKTKSTNFTIGNSTTQMQFYKNMRFPKTNISYFIEKCPLPKKDEMLRAFRIIEEETILDFYESGNQDAEIIVSCDSKAKSEGGLFIAGEGGPVNITETQSFNVIRRGKILLLKESKCENPNVAIHELFHVLGFGHSENSNNIMYPVSKCSQVIGEDTINFINEIYSIPSLPDLSFENASAEKTGSHINLNFTIRNNGLANSIKAEIIAYEDEKEIERYNFESLDIGYGRTITSKNIFSLKKNVEKIRIEIIYDGKELDKENNILILEIKRIS